MKSHKLALLVFLSLFLLRNTLSVGAPNKGQPFRNNSQSNQMQEKRLSAGCAEAKAQADLDINNVRARIFSCGDMWWDLSSTAKYEVPKVTQAGQVSICSMFAGSLWIGGTENGNLKIAAMTYRQSGVDFYCGPLDTSTANVASANTCAAYDRLFEVTRTEIQNFQADPVNGITDDITNWPGNGIVSRTGLDGNIAANLAPYVDVDHNMTYDPQGGDYPDVYGDQVLWYVYNDVGGAHTETKGQAIGLECQEEAFEFSTNDEINNMTFYKTIVINRSGNTLKNTWFGQWCDPDLGYAFDDYVGCDTTRQLGYDYNGEDFDPGLTGYGNNPPAVGAAFFHGPIGDDGKVIGMSRFVYYNNTASNVNGNPGLASPNPQDYYNYLQGLWINGAHMKYGTDGVSGSVNTNYMYPGDPTLSGTGGGWTEKSAGNQFGDRRFLESSGPFTLLPGARNEVTVAVIWARTNAGGATGSIGALKLATDLAKVTYNNNFNILYGADAPAVVIRGLDQKLVIVLQNTNTPNVEQYNQKWVDENNDTVDYQFEGYLVYQLANSSVSQADYNDINSARLIAQCDLKDSITGAIANYDTLSGVQNKVNIIELASQPNAGLSHTFEVTTDAFNSNTPIVNDKPYYFSVISYSTLRPKLRANYEANFVGSKHNVQVIQAIAHKNEPEFGGTQLRADYGTGPQITRIEGTGNGGNILNFTQSTLDTILMLGHMSHPTYQGGSGPVNIKVYDPTILAPGNFVMKLTDSTIKSNPANGVNLSEVSTTSGTLVPSFIPSANWAVTNTTTGGNVKSQNSIIVPNEQLLTTGQGDSINYWGMSASILQPYGPGNSNLGLVQDPNDGFLQGTTTFEDSNYKWLSGVASVPIDPSLFSQKIPTPGNWIRSGGNVLDANWTALDGNAAMTYVNPNYPKHSTSNDTLVAVDPFGAYSKVLGGVIAPAPLVAKDGSYNGSLTMGDVPSYATYTQSNKNTGMENLNSVDLVFTPDQSKWSRCIVIEMGESAGLNQGNAAKFSLRAHASWNGKIDAGGNPVYDSSSTGMSYFPGYAVNLETGDRLNVFFSEDSHLPQENGADMLWNPTSDMFDNNAGYLDYIGRYLWGGKHWIYVMNSSSANSTDTYHTRYDSCKTYYNLLSNSSTSQKNLGSMWSSLIWVGEPLLATNEHLASLKDGLIPSVTTISLRVSKPYSTYSTSSNPVNNNLPYYTFSTNDIAPVRNSAIGKDALSEVGISPNPYYAGSLYETKPTDNRVRFVNIPTKCEIKIYTLDGVLVRTYTQDQVNNQAYKTNGTYPATYLDWDLTNQQGVPVASGVYLIHVNAYDLGEKVIKWFGVMKPLELDTF